MAGEGKAGARKTRQMRLDEALWRVVAYQSPQSSREEKAAAASKVEELLAKGADPNAWKCLHSAVRGESIKIASLLKDAGASLEQRDRQGLSPLMWALASQRAAMVDWLLRAGADPNAEPGPGGERPLDFAARSRDLEACKALIKAGARALPNQNGETALHHAVSYASAEILRLLALEAECDMDARDQEGRTALDKLRGHIGAFEREKKLELLQSEPVRALSISRREASQLDRLAERGRPGAGGARL